MSALTKMFIVLQLVFSLVCAVLLVMFISKTENYKTTMAAMQADKVGMQASYANSERAKTLAETNAANLQAQLNDAINQLTMVKANAASESSRLNGELASKATEIAQLKATNQALSAASSRDSETIAANNAELAKLRPHVAEKTKEYAELYRAKNEVDNQLRAAELAIRKLQEMIAQMPGGGTGAVAPIGSGDQIQVLTASNVTGTGKVNAQISDVAQAQGRTMIEMPLGERDGIKVGTKMFVYRSTGYVGDATVERVSPDQSVGVVISTKPGETVKVGDLVSTVGQ